MSMAVSGSQASYQAAFQRLQDRVKEAVEERRAVVARQQALSAREQAEEEEEAFVLDPSLLTVKDLQLRFSAPAVSACLSALYVSPPTVRALMLERQAPPLAHSVPIPLVVCQVRNVVVTARAANNPWVGDAQCSVGAVRVFVQPAGADGAPPSSSSKPPLPLLALPRVTASIHVEQTSSVGRSVGGGLDVSCFDYKIVLESGFLRATLHPHSFRAPADGPGAGSGGESSSGSSGGSGSGTTTRSIWSAFRPLHHLWARRAHWALASSSSSASSDGTMPPASKVEATLRLGDAYTAYPKRANVLSEVWGNVSHRINAEIEQHYRAPSAYQGPAAAEAADSSHSHGLLPAQATTVTFMSPTRRCLDVEVSSLASPEALALAAQLETAEGWHSGSSSGADDDDDASDYTDTEPADAALHRPSSGPGALSNVGSGVGKATAVAATGIYNILTLGGILPSAIEAASGVPAGPASGAAGGRSLDDRHTLARRRWMLEKAELEARIRRLESELGR